MYERLRFVGAHKRGEDTVAGLCRAFGVSRNTEALGQEPPASCYRPSSRPYPEKLEYPAHFELRRVRGNGTIRWGRRSNLVVTQALAGEVVGLEPVDEDLWSLHFGPTELATIDERDGEPRLVPHVAGPPAWPLAWWLAEAPTGGPSRGRSAPAPEQEATA